MKVLTFESAYILQLKDYKGIITLYAITLAIMTEINYNYLGEVRYNFNILEYTDYERRI